MLRKDLPIRTDLMDGISTVGVGTLTIYANPIVSKVRTNLLSDAGGITIPEPLIEVPWNPSYIDTALWLDASVSASVILDGSGNVSQWLDLSGNDRHAIQTISANRPAVLSSYLNGLDSIQFDGVNDFLRGQSSNPIGDGDSFTIIAVSKNAPYTRGLDTLGGWSVQLNNNAVSIVAGGVQYGAVGANFSSDCIHATELIKGSTLKRFVNGSLDVTSSVPSANLRTSSVTYNLGMLTNPSKFAPSIISELIVINSTVTQDIFDKITGYLAHKRGLALDLPVGHPYKNNAPTIFN